MSNDLKLLKNKLFTGRVTAMYNIFSQQALHEYFKHCHKNKVVPYDLPGLIDLSGNEISLEKFKNDLDAISNTALVDTKRSANAFVTRNWINETFRSTDSYCKKYNQMEVMRAEPWHDFIRPYINAWVHGNELNFKGLSSIRKRLEKEDIVYRSNVLKLSMQGEKPSLTLQSAYEICEDILAFVETL